MKRLLLIGGGHAHVEVLRSFGEQRLEGAQIVVATPYPWLTYSGMVPGFVAGHYSIDDCTIDVARVAARAHATLVLSPVVSMDARARTITCANGAQVGYDVASLDVGSQSPVTLAAGIEQNAILMRPLERMVKGWNEVLARARTGGVRSVTLVGAGAAGIELALAMHHRFRSEMGEVAPHVRVLGDAPVPLPEFGAGARRRLVFEMERRRMESHHGSRVVDVGRDYVRLENGLEFATDAVFWAAGSAAHGWIAPSGLATDARGYLLTNDLLQSVSHPEVFGAGDCATGEGHPLPKAGVFSVRAGPALANNLRAAVAGRPLQPHLTSRRYLALVSTGDRYAVGIWNGLSFEGAWAWRWKDRIDRRFVDRYRG